MPTLKEMRKSFALCEAFGLTPFPSPWIPSAREGLSAGKLPPTQPSVAERGRISRRRGAEGPPPPSKPHPSPGTTPSWERSHAPGEGSGVGVEDDHGRSACSRGAAVKLHVEITSRSQSANL